MRGSVSTVEADLLDAQWASMREGTLTAMAKAAELRDVEVLLAAAPAAAAEGEALGSLAALQAALPKHVDLGKLVPLVDVSGSMSGTPMEVAIALGILVSECTAPAFRDRLLTFETRPSWVDLSDCTSLRTKVQKTQAAPWGGSTDFEAACERAHPRFGGGGQAHRRRDPPSHRLLGHAVGRRGRWRRLWRWLLLPRPPGGLVGDRLRAPPAPLRRGGPQGDRHAMSSAAHHLLEPSR